MKNGLGSMLKADARRMFMSRMFYIVLAISLVLPILILVMTSMAGGAGGMAAFTNTWQAIGSKSGESSAMAMDMTSMMNINLIFFISGIFVCVFVSEDFVSGYAKNIFAVRAKKSDYAASKIIVCFIGCALFFIAFFAGAIIGGKIAGLSFELGGVGVGGIMMCILSKIFLSGVFVAIAVLVGVIAKRRTWLSVLLFLFAGMLLFMMIPMITPLDAGIMNVAMCLAGGALFAAACGAVSSILLNKTDIV